MGDAEAIQPITVLGVDQSTTATGLCVVRWHPVSGPDVLYARTVEPSGLQDLFKPLHEVWDYTSYRPVAMAREQGFFSAKTPAAGLEIERAGGWVECFTWGISQYLGLSLARYRVMAIEWRRVVWGVDYAKLPKEQAKDFSIQFFKHHLVQQKTEYTIKPAEPMVEMADMKLDDHMADAMGIACWCGQHHYNLTLEGGPG